MFPASPPGRLHASFLQLYKGLQRRSSASPRRIFTTCKRRCKRPPRIFARVFTAFAGPGETKLRGIRTSPPAPLLQRLCKAQRGGTWRLYFPSPRPAKAV